MEDCAQAPMGKYKGKYVGTIGDIGVFSLNYHKHIHGKGSYYLPIMHLAEKTATDKKSCRECC
jgi:dTDP-4-amino-4,6-dideoxygalactose transaminase